MKATGIVRRIDDLGRIVIPKEIRRTLRFREADPVEIFTGTDGEIILKKYSPVGELGEFARQYADWLYGINLTTYASIKMGDGMYNVGRVISAIVRAIYERDMEIKNFVSKKYLVGYSNEETNGEKIELIDKEKFEADSNDKDQKDSQK